MTKTSAGAGNADSSSLAAAVSALGHQKFPDALLGHLSALVQVDHLALFRFDHFLVPELFGTASLGQSQISRDAGKLYQRRQYYRHDPGAQQVGSGADTAGPLLFRLNEQDILDREYHDRIYTRYRIIERISMIHRVENSWIAVNLYRSIKAGVFGPRDLENLEARAPAVLALAGKHAELIRPTAATTGSVFDIDAVYRELLGETLSARERSVCSGALRGLSVKRMAAELGVRPSTIATLRRRAFQKLGISNSMELFVRCIAALTDIKCARGSRSPGQSAPEPDPSSIPQNFLRRRGTQRHQRTGRDQRTDAEQQ